MSIIGTHVGSGVVAGRKGFRANRSQFSHWNIRSADGAKQYGGRRHSDVMEKVKEVGGVLIPVLKKVRNKRPMVKMG